jgi:hypothetical protein
MRKTKRGTQKRRQLAKEAQERTTKVGRLYQNAATTGLKATSRSAGDINDGFRQIADEMNEYSMRSIEHVFQAWRQFLDAGPLRQVVEFQTQYAQNAQNAYEVYVDEISRIGDLYLNVTRQVSKPLGQMSRRAKWANCARDAGHHWPRDFGAHPKEVSPRQQRHGASAKQTGPHFTLCKKSRAKMPVVTFRSEIFLLAALLVLILATMHSLEGIILSPAPQV